MKSSNIQATLKEGRGSRVDKKARGSTQVHRRAKLRAKTRRRIKRFVSRIYISRFGGEKGGRSTPYRLQWIPRGGVLQKV